MLKNIDHFSLNFRPDYSKKKTYCITIPPPNITGYLHMGHAFQCTLMDVLVRYYRMNNFSVLWKMGIDHAGIATQILMESKYPNKKIDELLKLSYIWKKKSFRQIKHQLLKLECSLFFKTSRFTLDNHFSYAVKKAFIDLYYENLIYKSEKLVNWDTTLQTAVSDLEVLYLEENTNLYYIKYKIVGKKDEYIIVSTSRPETIFADVAVALNPDDSRRLYLENKFLEVPITGTIVPIIFSTKVDLTFGSAALKITPCHDFNDFEMSNNYSFPLINILNKNGTLNNIVPEKYRGLSISNARSLVLNDLASFGLLEKAIVYKSKIPRCDRTNSIIEPFLTDQWYVKTKPLMAPVLESIKNDNIKILPSKWKKDFINWLENIKDWCISRQIWWGHRLPVWYDKFFNYYVAENEKVVRKKFYLNNSIELFQVSDVLDTWFSSALWPFASLGWPIMKKEYLKFYPTNTLVTGFDIIFFWVIRMLMFGLKFTGKLPFSEIYIHGLIRDNFGNKMSKTKGNVIDPIDVVDGISLEDLIKKRTLNLINLKHKERIIKSTTDYFPDGIKKFGIDALRLTFFSIAIDSMFLKFDFKKLEKYNNFCNKLSNASIFLNIKINSTLFSFYEKKISNIYTIWILSIWQRTKKIINSNIINRNFFCLVNNVYKFFWHNFCDWYIEISKILIKNFRHSFMIKYVMNKIFYEFLIVLNPIIPKISEDLFNRHGYFGVIYKSSYPKIDYKCINFEKENNVIVFKKLCNKIRSVKPFLLNASCISIFVLFVDINGLKFFEKIKSMVYKFCNVKRIYLFDEINIGSDYIKLLILNFFVLIPFSNNDKEKKFIIIKLNKMKIEKDRIEAVLKNDNFLKKASNSIINLKKKKFSKIKKDLLMLESFLI